MDNITKLASIVMSRRAAPQSGLTEIIKIAMKKIAATKYEQAQLQQQPWRSQPFTQAYDTRKAQPQNYKNHTTHSWEMLNKPSDISRATKSIQASTDLANMAQKDMTKTTHPELLANLQERKDFWNSRATQKKNDMAQKATLDPSHSSVDANFLRTQRAGNKNFTDNIVANKQKLLTQLRQTGSEGTLAKWRDNTASNIAMNFGAKGVSGVDWNTTQKNLGVGPGKGFIPMLQGKAKSLADADKVAPAGPAPGMPLVQDIGKFLSEQGSWGKKAVDFTKGLYNTVKPHIGKAVNYFTAPAPGGQSPVFRPAYGVM